MKKIANLIKQHKYLVYILAGGLFLRLIGLAHGFPYVFNIDEPALVRSSLGLRFSWYVDHFDWPHLNFYLNYIFYEVFIKFRALIQLAGLRSYVENAFPMLWSDPFIFYFLSRFLNALFSTFAVIPIYMLSRKFLDRRYSLIGVLAYMLIPLNLILSKYALQEPVQLFFLAWTVYFAYEASIRNNLKSSLWFGLFLGLSAGIKYNAVFFAALPLLFFAFIHKFNKKESFIFVRNLVAAGILSLIVLVLTTFSIFKYWDVAWSDQGGRGLIWQFTENIKILSAEQYKDKLIENYNSFSNDLGGGIFILSLLGIVGIVIMYSKSIYENKERTLDLKISFVLALFFIFYFVYTSRYSRSGGHYFMVLHIFIPFLFAKGMQTLDSFAKTYRVVVPKNFCVVCLSLVICAMGLSAVLRFAIPDNYSSAINFVNEQRSLSKISGQNITIYVSGENLSTANAINNLGFKIYEDDSKIILNDLVVTEEEMTSEDFQLVKSFEIADSLNGPVKVYAKNK